jgi:hypothetical protein
VTELLGSVKDLFTGSEHKFPPAIGAGQSPVNEFHNRFLPNRGRVAYDSEWPLKIGLHRWSTDAYRGKPSAFFVALVIQIAGIWLIIANSLRCKKKFAD